ncbi:hypothetical protein [Micromonospora chersina]|uniref:hypothetical protein n=1 Tax=Micromonospora chersina TaxID=47854 RepID=UPI0033D428AC
MLAASALFDQETVVFGALPPKFIGTAMTAGGELGSVIRRAVAPRLHLVPGLTDLATDSRTPSLRRSDLVVRPRLRGGLAGGLCPNAIVDGDRRLDDVAAGRFAIVTSIEPTPALRADIERPGAVLITVLPGSELHRWLGTGAARAAVVRPDGTVLRADRRLLPRTMGAVPRTATRAA